MSKILDWIKKHVWQSVLIGFGLFLVPLIFVHIAYKIPAISPWFASTWEPGELITYIAGFEAFIGTVALGAVAIHQNNKANELNERMLNAEKKRDLFDRQPKNHISDCSCDVVGKCDLYKKEPIRDSMIYHQTQPYSITPDENFDAKKVFLSFDITNDSGHAFTFGLKNIQFQNYNSDEPLQTLSFNLTYCGNTSSNLLPNNKQSIIFIAQEGTFARKTSYIIIFSFCFRNLLGESFYEEKKFVLTSLSEKDGHLSFLGN